MDRRELLQLGISIGTLATTSRVASAAASPAGAVTPATSGPYTRCFEPLDRYVAQYMSAMNIPGMTLALADANGVQLVRDYGVEDLELRRPLPTGRLFQIGSISKSFVAVCLMQLRDEGRFDPQRPINEYFPWVRYDGFDRPITSHDLMTHAAAMPDGPTFPADPAFRYRSTAPAGAFFHYCNMGWAVMGFLVEKLDGRPLAVSLRERVFKPLGMDASEGAINLDNVSRIAMSYQPERNDRPLPRSGALVQGAPIVYTEGAGCIASTAHDMGQYARMIINRGAVDGKRLMSPEGFALFTHRHIAADEFGKGASYGYGLAIDVLDGHTRLSHTGGMVSFSSALQVDIDAGVGAFASINAMQGGRPSDVVEHALRLMRACKENAATPTFPPHSSPLDIQDAADYAGAYTGANDHVLQVIADGDRLYLKHRDARVPMEAFDDSDDAFIVLHEDFAHYPLAFTRASAHGKGPVTEAGWGERWYAGSAYQGASDFPAPAEWSQYTGHYRTEDPWIGSIRIVARRGRLWFNGVTPLEAGADGRFYLRDEPTSPEWVSFNDIVNGSAMVLRYSGYVLQRVE
jgi:CubicO group peptidase (beta-lactamase class C family)